MPRYRYKNMVWLLALALVMACAPTLTFPPATPPTLDQDAVNRIVQQTAAAASSQTAAAVPTSTLAERTTPTPRGSDTPEPTGTNTVVFLFYTPTVVVLPSSTGTFRPTSKKDYTCEVISSPTDGTIYSPRLPFKVRWRFKNIGRKDWDGDSVDFVYDHGDRFHKTSGYDLEKTVEVGYVAELFVDMQAPKDPGNYTTHWTLMIGTEKFCSVSLTIGVK